MALLELNWGFGYPAILVLMATIAAGLLTWFRSKGWAGRDKE